MVNNEFTYCPAAILFFILLYQTKHDVPLTFLWPLQIILDLLFVEWMTLKQLHVAGLEAL
jgi:hypothetical protein